MSQFIFVFRHLNREILRVEEIPPVCARIPWYYAKQDLKKQTDWIFKYKFKSGWFIFDFNYKEMWCKNFM